MVSVCSVLYFCGYGQRRLIATLSSRHTPVPHAVLEVPAAPPPGLPAALTAGLIPTIEAYLRTITRPYSTASPPHSSGPCTASPSAASSSSSSSPSASSPASTTAASPGCLNAEYASQHAASLFVRLSGQNLVLLLAYGDPMQGAALLTTMAKAALCHTEASARAGFTAGVNGFTCMTLSAFMNLHIALCPEREDCASAAACSAPAGGGSAAPAAGLAPDATEACQHSPAEEQLKQLYAFAVPRWLPVLERLYTLCKPVRDLESWDSYGSYLEKLLAGLLGAAASGCQAAWAAGDVRAVASWRQLLQRDVCVRDWVGGEVLSEWEAEAWWAAAPPQQQLHPPAGDVDASEGLAAGGGSGPAAAATSTGGASRCPWPFLRAVAPCEAASLLPTCSNPLCTVLEGDTETSLGLAVVGPGAETASLSAGVGAGPGATASRSVVGAERVAGERHGAESLTPAAKGKGKRKGKGAGKGKGAEAGAAADPGGAVELGSGAGPAAGGCFRYCSVACRTAHMEQQRLNFAKLRRP